jgi:hypothetical protein
MKIAFWDIVPWSLVKDDSRFKGAYYLHHQGDHLKLHGAISQKDVTFHNVFITITGNGTELGVPIFLIYIAS